MFLSRQDPWEEIARNVNSSHNDKIDIRQTQISNAIAQNLLV